MQEWGMSVRDRYSNMSLQEICIFFAHRPRWHIKGVCNIYTYKLTYYLQPPYRKAFTPQLHPPTQQINQLQHIYARQHGKITAGKQPLWKIAAYSAVTERFLYSCRYLEVYMGFSHCYKKKLTKEGQLLWWRETQAEGDIQLSLLEGT